MAKGKLYGISVGPGDPELLTLRAARILQEVDCIAAPDIGGSNRTALRIVERYIAGKEVIDCSSPMTNDTKRTGAAYDATADILARYLDAGQSVAFVTLGDASVYSTWSYVYERMAKRGYDIEVVAGVTSFCAAAAALQVSLCERSEQLVVSPVSTGDVAGALSIPGTKVFMKSGKHLGQLRETLREYGLAEHAGVVVNCGLEGEQVIPNLDEVAELSDYMSIVIVKDPRSAVNAAGSQPAVQEPAGSEPAPFSKESVTVRLEDALANIAGPDEAARQRSVDTWNAVAKPIGSLGVLERDITSIAALVGTEVVSIDKRAVVVLCADNGVVAEGVSQCGQDVTTAVANNVAKHISSVCKMAACANTDAIAVDMGMAQPSSEPGVIDCSLARGTSNIAKGPAMTREQAVRAIETGIDLVGYLASQGYRLIASGEMGIGNTTTSSAMTAVLLDVPIEEVTGRGAGLSDAGLVRKQEAIRRASAVNRPDADDPLDVLAKLGGFDIAGMVGLFIGGALHRVPIIIDGFISTLAAYVAKRLCPACTCAMLASHVSAEPAARYLMEELGVEPAIQAGLRLGEGTGAVCLIPMLDMALALYNGTTFEETGIDAYEVDIKD